MQFWSSDFLIGVGTGAQTYWSAAASWQRVNGDVYIVAPNRPAAAVDGPVEWTLTQSLLRFDGWIASERTLGTATVDMVGGESPDWTNFLAYNLADNFYGLVYTTNGTAPYPSFDFRVFSAADPAGALTDRGTLVSGIPTTGTGDTTLLSAFNNYLAVGFERDAAPGREIVLQAYGVPSLSQSIAPQVVRTLGDASLDWRLDFWNTGSLAVVSEEGPVGNRVLRLTTHRLDGTPGGWNFTVGADALMLRDPVWFDIDYYTPVNTVDTLLAALDSVDGNPDAWQVLFSLRKFNSTGTGSFDPVQSNAFLINQTGTPAIRIAELFHEDTAGRGYLVYYTDGDNAYIRRYDPVSNSFSAPFLIANDVTPDELGSYISMGDGRYVFYYTVGGGLSGEASLVGVMVDMRDAGQSFIPDPAGVRLAGTAYDDVFEGAGATGADWIAAGAGNDVIQGSDGADTLDGGDGTDMVDYSGSTSGVTVNLAWGRGYLSIAAGDRYVSIEDVIGTAQADVLWGNDGDNLLQGEAGNDFLRGGGFLGTGSDSDTLLGGDGDDVLVAGPGEDILDGGAGSDQVRYDYSDSGVTLDLEAATASGGWAEGDTLLSIEEARGSVHDDVLRGSSAGNVLLGLAGDDVIEGVAGVNYLYGNAGQDRLIAGTGDDRMKGGVDSDTFVFGPDQGFNYIRGFERTLDRIEIDDGTPGTAVFDDLTITKLSWGTRIDYDVTTIALVNVTGAITDANFDFV